MKFDKSKVFTTFNCDEVKVGSKGYFADSKEGLISRVQSEAEIDYDTLYRVDVSADDFVFLTIGDCPYRYFYLVEEPQEPKKRACTKEELIEILKKQGLPMLKNKDGKYYTISKIDSTRVIFCDELVFDFDYENLCLMFTLLDGTELWVEE